MGIRRQPNMHRQNAFYIERIGEETTAIKGATKEKFSDIKIPFKFMYRKGKDSTTSNLTIERSVESVGYVIITNADLPFKKGDVIEIDGKKSKINELSFTEIQSSNLRPLKTRQRSVMIVAGKFRRTGVKLF